MFVGRVACFIYWDEGSQLAKSIFESVDGLDTFDFHGNNKSARRFSAAADWALHRGIREQRCARR